MTRLLLASTSPYRRLLLERLGLPFEVARPEVTEAHLPGEAGADRALRLSLAKAQAVAAKYPEALVIGGDQVAAAAHAILDKPGTVAAAHAQLTALGGTSARFYTGCALVGVTAGIRLVHVDTTTTVFRTLSSAEIERYIERERPLDCAGGFKAEGLGIALFESIDTQDPTALIGIPLIWLASALRRAGLPVP